MVSVRLHYCSSIAIFVIGSRGLKSVTPLVHGENYPKNTSRLGFGAPFIQYLPELFIHVLGGNQNL